MTKGRQSQTLNYSISPSIVWWHYHKLIEIYLKIVFGIIQQHIVMHLLGLFRISKYIKLYATQFTVLQGYIDIHNYS